MTVTTGHCSLDAIICTSNSGFWVARLSWGSFLMSKHFKTLTNQGPAHCAAYPGFCGRDRVPRLSGHVCLSSLKSQTELSPALYHGGRRRVVKVRRTQEAWPEPSCPHSPYQACPFILQNPARTSCGPYDSNPNPWYQERIHTASVTLN